MLQRYMSPCSCALTLNQKAGTSGGRALQLCFVNQLPETIFTQCDIKAEGGLALQIELRDAANQQRVVKDEGSSMRIKICVLDGDFGSEDWTAEEFNAQILSPREGKGPLLVGGTIITLKNGVGYISKKIVFTDNSSGTRSRKFRLGVKIVQSNSSRTDIREGRSEPFKVLDYRGKANMKYGRPSLNDEVWRLKKIARNGEPCKQLSSHGIKTVKDLLRLYITNQASLREKIGKIPEKSWNTIIEHAQDSDKDDDERYIYHTTEQPMSLVLNCVYEVVEVTFDGQNYRPVQSLNLEEKRLVERAKKQANNNLKDLHLMPVGTTKHGSGETSPGVQTAQYGEPDHGLQQFEIPIVQQGQLEALSFGTTSQSDLVGLDQLGETPPYCSAGGPLNSGAYTDDGNRSLFGEAHIDEFSDCFPPLDHWEEHVGPTYFSPDGNVGSSTYQSFSSNESMPSRGKCKQIWQKIRNTFLGRRF
ncbi:calmodulin-binding protein 60 B-like isoform X2 [Lotus japonicus]|uniref:calmodulin-binding protein 60 B-like isoform X2 n=1 Tax=Lotus japonicus TaxID=34305 RepID=UPI00258527F5|nr:calmodulin-binding protein 60 B-like isoform X2 [Lotus japonicus]